MVGSVSVKRPVLISLSATTFSVFSSVLVLSTTVSRDGRSLIDVTKADKSSGTGAPSDISVRAIGLF